MRLHAILVCALLMMSGCESQKPQPRRASMLAAAPTSRPVVRAWTTRPYPAGEVNLLAMGDWGSDNKPQRQVAEHLAQYVQSTGIQFQGLLSPGDNIYTPMKNEAYDMEWQRLFEDMYDARRINMPFYCVLGNHDFERSKAQGELNYAALNPHSRFKLPAPWYRLDFPSAENPLVTVLMVDSDRFVITDQVWRAQREWLVEQLSQPRKAKWLVLCAHHSLISNGRHGDNGLLQRDWGDLVRTYRVDFYVAGHEHNTQHLESPHWPSSFIVVGGGARDKTLMRRDDRGLFSRSIYGFAHMRFLPDRAIVRLCESDEKKGVMLAHEFERDPEGRIAVTFTTRNDKGDKKETAQKPFDEGDRVTPAVPTEDPEIPRLNAE